MCGAVDSTEQRQGGVAVVQRHGVIAGLLQHVFKKTALHRIVVDDEDTPTHDISTTADCVVPNWVTLREEA